MISTVMTRRMSWLTLPVALAVTVVTFGLGFWQKYGCQAAGWPYKIELIFGQRCYSDVPFLLQKRGMADGVFPYAPEAGQHPLEYPVLSGLTMDVTARLARVLTPDRGAQLNQIYFALTVLLLLGLALLTVWATVRTTGDPFDGLLVALAPTLALAGTINWDLLAVAATALAMLAWSRGRRAGGGSGRNAWLAGVFIGLGTAAKLYPVVLLGPIVVLAVRRRQWRPAARAVGAAAAAWLVVNLPVMIGYPDGWQWFYRFNQDRGAEFGSPWYALELLKHPVPEDALNSVVTWSFLAGCVGVAALALFVRPVPSLAPLAFLVVAVFLVTNKVYSPQYVLWLLPLAVLCRSITPPPHPAGLRLPDLLLWQAVEVTYWFAIWAHLDHRAIDDRWYAVVVFLRIAVTLWLCARVVVGLTRPGQWRWSLRQVLPSEENAAQPAGSAPNRS